MTNAMDYTSRKKEPLVSYSEASLKGPSRKNTLKEGGSEIKFVFSIESDETRMIELDIILPSVKEKGRQPWK